MGVGGQQKWHFSKQYGSQTLLTIYTVVPSSLRILYGECPIDVQ